MREGGANIGGMALADRMLAGQSSRWFMLWIVPLAAFVLLSRFPSYDPLLLTPVGHVILVGGSSFIGAVLSYIAAVAGNRLNDARIVLLSLAFFAVSGFSIVHALLTPDVFFPYSSTGLGWTQVGGYVIGGFLLALSSLPLSALLQQRLLQNRNLLYGGLLAAMVIALSVSVRWPHLMVGAHTMGAGVQEYGTGYGLTSLSGTIVIIVTVFNVAMLSVAIYRYVQDYRLARLPLLALVVSGLLLFTDGVIGLAYSRVWHLSWWTYHVLVFAGFGAILLGILTHMGRGETVTDSVRTLFVQDTVQKLEQSYNDTIVAMINSVEAKDAYTRGHSARVTLLATLIAEELRLSPERLRILHQSALVHDVGKIGIPDAILNKPGRLTPEEYAVIKEHPVKGVTILRNVGSLRPMLDGVRSHHERWDGKGYPDGLAGERIPLNGRIIAVADVFDALTSARAYRPAWPFDQAVDEIHNGSGSQFEVRMVEAFDRALPHYREQLKRVPDLAHDLAPVTAS
ncbi:MAG TPA: HD-GYP domain-containing protein [bacterium]